MKRISSELSVCDGVVRSILLLPLVAMWLDTIICVYIMNVVMTVWGNVCCVAGVVKDTGFKP